MKKTLTKILTLMLAIAIAVSTSGCSIIAGELGKEEEKRLILSMLNEKYGEEFIVHSIESEGSGGNGVPNFKALFDFTGRYISYKTICSPKSNEEILFEAYEREKGTVLYDDYPHAVVKHLIKEEVEKVISKYSDSHAVSIYFREPSAFNCEDKEWGIEFLETVTPFTKASDITIESYSEKYLETAKASIHIAFEGNEYASIEKIEEIIEHFTSTFHKITIDIAFFFSTEQNIERCKKLTENSLTVVNFMSELRGEYPVIRFESNKKTNYKIVYDEEYSVFS